MWFKVTHITGAHPESEVQADSKRGALAYYAGLFGTRTTLLYAVPIGDPFAVPVDPQDELNCDSCQ